MSAFDPANQSMQYTEPEINYIAPRIKLRDEMCDFIDDKWVNESSCQPPFASHQKLFNKKVQNEWSIWEENRVLWEKTQLLQIKNRMLWEENKALQCLQPHNNINVVNTDAVQQSLQKENELFPFFQERNIGFQVSPGHKALQMVQEINGVLEDFHQENKTVPISFKDQKAITVQEESKDASSDLQKDTAKITNVEEGNPGPSPQQEYKAKKKSTTPTQNKIKSAPGIQGEYEILRALQDLYQLLHIFLKVNHLLGEKQGCHILYDVSRSFQEDYNKLKMQLIAVKNTVSDITAQMEMLERELIDITSAVYEEAGQMLATEHQLGGM
ncbi:Spermatid-associated protein [Antrostomus carolinensis]|uniref:Spermatid-associated protein n=1 Tax=Antrostomus carolinensis TaxID=279965 RepID=A0A094NEM6_ANTCR|nr:spermatid-associated protein [Antrostomus carolinensis]KFZ65001.1 Spermatid-associated protein [Antrostomus carolinensis]